MELGRLIRDLTSTGINRIATIGMGSLSVDHHQLALEAMETRIMEDMEDQESAANAEETRRYNNHYSLTAAKATQLKQQAEDHTHPEH